MEAELEVEVAVDMMDEVTSEVENFSLEDLSISLEPEEDLAKDTISKSLVGKFLTKRPVSNGLLRAVLDKVWRPKRGWKMQCVVGNIYVFRFQNKEKVEFILENCPWSPCDGFMLIKPLPPDGRWQSTDLN